MANRQTDCASGNHDLTGEERAFVERRREALRQDGLVSETYRRAGVREALTRLASAGLD